MNYFIFVVKDQKKDGKEISADDIFNTRMDQKRWGLAEKAPNRRLVQSGDHIIFYKGGPEGKVFIASATADSQAEQYEGDPIAPGHKQYFRVQLKNIDIWDKPKPVSDFFNKVEFIQNTENWGSYFQGGAIRISEKDFNIIVESPYTPSNLDTPGKDISTTEFVLEKYLEDFIVTNWDSINFGRKLKIFTDTNGNFGQQYFTDVGYIDILAQDENGNFVVIELKKGKPSDQVIGQTLRYISWVKKNLCKENQKVEGMLIVGGVDKKLQYSIEEVKNLIKIKIYSIDFALHNQQS